MKRKVIKLCALANIIRFNLLNSYGGIWADSTLWCHRSLEDWFPYHSKEGFFAFSNPGPELKGKESPFLFMNYFLGAEKGHYIVSKLSNATFNYWQKHSSADEYLWSFSLFNQIYKQDDFFQKIWDSVPKIDAPIKDCEKENGGVEFFSTHKINPIRLSNVSPEFQKIIATTNTPMFKLSHHKHHQYEQFASIQYLFNTIA